jgi:hypothetical protein
MFAISMQVLLLLLLLMMMLSMQVLGAEVAHVAVVAAGSSTDGPCWAFVSTGTTC